SPRPPPRQPTPTRASDGRGRHLPHGSPDDKSRFGDRLPRFGIDGIAGGGCSSVQVTQIPITNRTTFLRLLCSMDSLQTKQQELERLRARVEQLEAEIIRDQAERGWQTTSYYTAYYASAGFLLGIFGAIVSLLFNVIGATIAGKTPLELIRVYLTFPLGA